MSKKNFQDVSLKNLLEQLKGHFLTIIGCGVIGFIGSLVISFLLMTPKYSSTVDLLVNQKSNDSAVQFNLQQADLQAINTYKDVLKKPVILKPVLKQAKEKDNYTGTIDDLTSSIKIGNETNSKVISVTVTDKNAYVAADISNSIAKVFTKKIKDIMKINNVVVVTKGSVDEKPVSPNKKINALLGIAIGLLLGVIAILLRSMFDKTVKDSDYLTEELGLINLGQIYHLSKDEDNFQVVNILTEQDPSKNANSRRHRV